MKKAIGIIVLVALIGGAIWYTQNHKPNSDKAATAQEEKGLENTKENETGVAQEKSFTGSISELAKSGKSYECTFNSNIGGASTSGHVYIAGDNVQGSFETTVPQYGKVTSHMIADNAFTYSWSSMSNQGYKFPKMKTSGTTPSNAGMSGSQSFDMNQNYGYNCKGWTKDPSFFVPPANITFKSY